MRQPDLKAQVGFARQRLGPAVVEPPDRTELDQLRDEVKQLRKRLRAKDDFIAIAAHELRNPMTPILGIAQLAITAARREPAGAAPAGAAPAGAAPAGSHRLVSLLEKLHVSIEDFIGRCTRLLDVSRIETGNFILSPEPLDLSELLVTISDRKTVFAGRAGSPMELAIAAGVTGIWDRAALTQIIENLLSNALKFGGAKPVTVRLARLGDNVRLEVEDRGIGLDAAQQAQIFGRFEDVVAKYRNGGFGIGLWVTHQLVTAMQGSISVHSRRGEGAIFTIILPRSGAPQS